LPSKHYFLQHYQELYCLKHSEPATHLTDLGVADGMIMKQISMAGHSFR